MFFGYVIIFITKLETSFKGKKIAYLIICNKFRGNMAAGCMFLATVSWTTPEMLIYLAQKHTAPLY